MKHQKIRILPQTTLVLLRKDGQVLLAMKKRGFGVGKWNGVGGKPDFNEPIEAAAVRECKEEIGVKPLGLEFVAELNFLFAAKPEWSQQVLVYISWEWQGDPVESEEMKPQWFALSDIPYSSMWPDDMHWLPRVLNNEKVRGEFHLTEDQKLERFTLSTL